MIRRFALRFNLLLAIAALSSAGSAATGEPTDPGWIDLGSPSVWRGYRQEEFPESWSIDPQSVITTDGQAGVDLVTRDEFGDFDLRFEWKITPAGNSGVLYRVTEKGDATYHTGPEYQVLDNNGIVDLESRHSAGAIYGLYPPTADAANPAGEWNTARIMISNGHVRHWVNDQLVAEATIGSDDWRSRVAETKFAAWERFAQSPRGRIALQQHGARVWYRGMRVLPLEAHDLR
ncbi:hypothetical protein Mal64_17370 [Pseudobythopirellula maris]|uniref:3-keto-alpha-glucoside-1,2-lyase/3-keto-2-hydroxy-glucal hydratase domain-containing protein n=1 Tax=Pseudobythopirellula maris TaxID=2527991 RepID=A0A5C5ZM16_9BACT|nr:DUF1080 domain-containing protein [Pseudobythopirellula maris]TWT88258.1 hypothetical protein Mal64_17370 [Pseudobythopirellula maris]